MAAELVGGAFLSATLQVLFDRMASRRVLNFLRGRRIDKEKLKRLKITLLAINVVLDDAEEKQIVNHNVKKWLFELRDVVYDAEDLQDEIDYEALRCELEGESQTGVAQVRNYLSSLNPFNKNRKMELKLEDTLDKIEYMHKQIPVLKLSEGARQRSQRSLRESSSLVEEAVIYGRDSDKEAIMKSLLSLDSDSKGIGVIPIFGMGGIGKTTLAQLVYNDNNVRESFEVRAWVCVSEESDVSRITQNLLREVTSLPCGDQTLNQLQLKLKDQLAERKFLIVLDDVWNMNHDIWDHLMSPLKSGAKGSRLILTTRNESIAISVQTLPIYRLAQLSDDSCWLLFKQNVSEDGNFSPPPSIDAMGRKIVDKCGGLPLAIKAIACALRSKMEVSEWEKILESNMWKEEGIVLPALQLSYHHLPSQLKRCFAYCSIFPKDYKIKKELLVRLWMAEGFLDHLDEKDREEIGGEYFNDLVARSFFQHIGDDRLHFAMHDLVSDLAEAVSTEYCCRLEKDVFGRISEKTRHLANVIGGDVKKKFKGVDKAISLRTFLTINTFKYNDFLASLSKTFTRDTCPKFRFLRVLSVKYYQNIEELPCSVDDLKHLRYLDLSRSSIKILPESICTLYKLQTLKLFKCWALVALPTNLGKLIDLSLLDIRQTQVKEMPLHIGRLKKLKTLTAFPQGKQSGSTIIELKDLRLLQGTLSILNLQNVVSARDALDANLRGKKNLKQLILSWSDDGADSKKERDILEKLQPHTSLESLVIENYNGTRFPGWVGDRSFSSLNSLRIEGCKNLLYLPCLGEMPSLRELSVARFDSVVRVDEEFSAGGPFRSLKKLSFVDMPTWEEWYSSESDFPCLEKLKLMDCPMLRKTLPRNLPSLTEIEIVNCPQLVAELPKAPALCKMKLLSSEKLLLGELPCRLDTIKISGSDATSYILGEVVRRKASCEQLNICRSILSTSLSTCGLKRIKILHCKSARSFPLELFPKLHYIRISECENLESLSASESSLQELRSLQSIRIDRCPKLVSFPVGGISAPNLREFQLRECSNLRSLPQHMCSLFPSLKLFSISDCEEVESFPKEGLPLRLEEFRISRCSKLMSGRRQWNLQKLPSLQSIGIKASSEYDAEFFEDDDFLPSTLSRLSISGFQNLQQLNVVQHLTSLQHLSFKLCLNLQSLPIHVLPASLYSLHISKCPLLAAKCRHQKGDYWPLISHIPVVEIDNELIT